jgi:hypothetical protein
VSIRSFRINSAPRKLLLLGALLLVISVNYFFGKWALANMASTHADIIEVAELAESLGPDDPQTHYATAVLYEKSFLPDDIARGLGEYAQAAALSPNNYLLWLDLGNARARDGDLPGSERALRIAGELAPNYGSVQWSLGNVLLRQGKTGDAFASIQKAAVADPEYAPAGANIAWQYFSGDIARIRGAVGDSPAIIGALIPLLSAQKRVDEALTFWNVLPTGKGERQLKQSGTTLYNDLIGLKRFRDAAYVYADVSADGAAKPEPGKIINGDFEGDIKMQGASAFEWAIADGLQPQIALTDGQKHGGGRSLVFVFNQNGTSDFRQISQTVVVDPGKTYELEAFYKGDLQTSASIQWEIVNGSDSTVLASTAKIVAAADWTKSSVLFTVPPTTDGIIIRLVKNGCSSASCPVTGKIWFDDFILNKK